MGDPAEAVSEVFRFTPKVMRPNNSLQPPAAVLGGREVAWRHNAEVAGACALLHPPSRSDRDYEGRAAAVPEPGH
jgi:hypothetical protein